MESVKVSDQLTPPIATAAMHRCGYVGVIGRSNVGKSTLMNRMLGRKLCVVSPKPQTTRCNLLGIKSMPMAQILFMDTPGLQRHPRGALNRKMNRNLSAALQDVDALLWVVVALYWDDLDTQLLSLIANCRKPVFLVVNKIDQVPKREVLLAYLKTISKYHAFQEIIPVSALRGENLAPIERVLPAALPLAPPRYPATRYSDRDEKFFAAEFLREQLMRRLNQELPYQLSVVTETLRYQKEVLHVWVHVWVAHRGQRRIVVGRGGRVLKAAGRAARRDMEQMFRCRVHLSTWVRVWTSRHQSSASSPAQPVPVP